MRSRYLAIVPLCASLLALPSPSAETLEETSWDVGLVEKFRGTESDGNVYAFAWGVSADMTFYGSGNFDYFGYGDYLGAVTGTWSEDGDHVGTASLDLATVESSWETQYPGDYSVTKYDFTKVKKFMYAIKGKVRGRWTIDDSGVETRFRLKGKFAGGID